MLPPHQLLSVENGVKSPHPFQLMSISSKGFEKGCENLCETWAALSNEGDVRVLSSVRKLYARDNAVQADIYQHGTKYLRITRIFGETTHGALTSEHDDHEYEDSKAPAEDDDDEALHRSVTSSQSISGVFDIVHSPSYQVPVLYVQIRDLSGSRAGKTLCPDEVYELLVPTMHKAELQAVGVMGALSMTDHPITGMPAYFVHPCRTAEAMSSLIGPEAEADAAKYLLLWFGLIGSSVGLTVPVNVAQVMNKSR